MLNRSAMPLVLALAALATTGLVGEAAADGEVNIYSARHYDTDQQLYDAFTEETGITVNRLEANAEELVERIKLEGENSPADVLITVDAGRLYRAEQEGLFQPVESKVLADRLPDELRHPDGLWFGFSKRVRVLYRDKDRIDPQLLQTYEDLARPELEGEVCIRSSSNIYNLSLMASLIHHHGEDEALAWAENVVSNFAREPQGGDTDQIRGIAAGECGVALGNHYYYLRLMASDDPADQEVVDKVELVVPNQDDRGAHINVSGAGVVATAPNQDNAVRFLEYLASDQAQVYFAQGNNEFPAVEGVDIDNPLLDELGDFKADDLNVAVLGQNQPTAQVLFDQAGWQ